MGLIRNAVSKNHQKIAPVPAAALGWDSTVAIGCVAQLPMKSCIGVPSVKYPHSCIAMVLQTCEEANKGLPALLKECAARYESCIIH